MRVLPPQSLAATCQLRNSDASHLRSPQPAPPRSLLCDLLRTSSVAEVRNHLDAESPRLQCNLRFNLTTGSQMMPDALLWICGDFVP